MHTFKLTPRLTRRRGAIMQTACYGFRFLFFFLLFSCIETCVALALIDLDAVEPSNSLAGVSIVGGIDSEPARENSVIFSKKDRLKLTIEYRFRNRPESACSIFVVCRVNDEWYMKDQADRWSRWDGRLESLTPARQGMPGETEHVEFAAGPGLPEGEYAVYTGIVVDGRLIYGRKAISFGVLDSTEGMHRVGHAEFLAAYLHEGLTKGLSPKELRLMDGVDIVPVALPDSMPGGADSASGNPVDFSTTNIQEEGVDEADVIKTDGRVLYRTGWCDGNHATPCIFSSRIQDNPAKSEPLDAMKLANGEQGTIYLLCDREEGRPDMVVHLSRRGGCYAYWDQPGWWQGGDTVITLIDVSNPSEMQQIASVRMDGILIASRRIGEILYLVTRNTPVYMPGPHPLKDPLPGQPEPDSINKKAETDQPDEVPDIDDMMPGISINGGGRMPLTQPHDCFIPPYPPEIVPEPSMITVTAIPLYDPEGFRSVSVAGKTDTVYVSTSSIYLATSSMPDYIIMPLETRAEGGLSEEDATDSDLSGDDGPEAVQAPRAKPPVPVNERFTDLHKFIMRGAEITYVASGRVPGHLGHEEDKKPFRMSEYRNHLRVITSIGETWNNTSSTSLYVLGEADTPGRLEIKGRLEKLGKPGERLYASRFAGDRGFLVTFRVTDPLYILDLADPAHPAVSGELHINGYSDYLHPLGENFLLGIGKDAVPDPFSTDMNGRGAWYQGVKLSLFDITPGHAPTEVRSIILGKRGTDSAALYDHHAITWLMGADNLSANLAIPVAVSDTMPQRADFNPSDPRSYWDWTSTGLHFFHIDLKGRGAMVETGRLITDHNPVSSKNSSSGRSTYGDRAVIQGGAVHYIHNDKVYSSQISALSN